MPFKKLISDPEILKAIEEMGYTTPTPIQEKAIPLILGGVDLRASAQTGTGKTAAFLLPTLSRLSTPSPVNVKGPRILILVPTRELAMQVAAESVKYSKYLSLVKTVCIFGGSPYPRQNKDLSRHYEILVATPGRLIDHMDRGRIDFSRLEVLILDEADRMLDMGFVDDVERIAASTPKSRQTLLFSATLKGTVLNLSKRLLNDPVEISIVADHSESKNIEQRLYDVDNLAHKYSLLDELLGDTSLQQAIVFTATKRQADVLVDRLSRNGQQVAVLHGGMKQPQRTRTITQMRQGKIRVLVATDVAARGIDVPAISHIINFDLPSSAEDYVHRIGRTGRAGATGIALTFAAYRDRPLIKQIERFTGQRLISQSTPKSASQSNTEESRSSRPRPSPDSRPFKPRSSHPGSFKPRSPRSESRPFESRSPHSRSPRPFESNSPRSESPTSANAFESRSPHSSRPFKSKSSRSEFSDSRSPHPRSSRSSHPQSSRSSEFSDSRPSHSRSSRPSEFSESRSSHSRSSRPFEPRAASKPSHPRFSESSDYRPPESDGNREISSREPRSQRSRPYSRFSDGNTQSPPPSSRPKRTFAPPGSKPKFPSSRPFQNNNRSKLRPKLRESETVSL